MTVCTQHFWSEWSLWKYAGRCFYVRECLWCKEEEKKDPESLGSKKE